MSAEAVRAIEQGKLVVIPTDTVYGLVASPFLADAVERMCKLKGREATQPTALMAPDVEILLELVPELRGRPEVLARALLPGPLTLVLPNPARRFRWLTGARPDTIGVRVPQLPDVAAEVLRAAGGLAATSANVHGGPDPTTLEDVPAELRAAAAAVLDGGALPGTPSTVVDFTGDEPKVLREGAVGAGEVLDRASAAIRS
jgi:L-threonylcarbamoyladenylate synthase